MEGANSDDFVDQLLALNRQYEAGLEAKLGQLRALLTSNIEQQRELEHESRFGNCFSSKVDVELPKREKIHLSFGAPYFKDADLQSPPKNEDAKLIEELNVPNIALKCCNKSFVRKFKVERWQVSENQKLKEEVSAYVHEQKDRDWDEIASRLGGERTAFGCFARYQSRYNPDHRKFRWNEQECGELVRGRSVPE